MRYALIAAFLATSIISFAQDWKKVKKVTAQIREVDQLFGADLALSDTTLVIGAPGDSYDTIIAGTPSKISSGTAHFITLNKKGKVLSQQKVWRPNGETNDNFGAAVGISGNWAVIGANGVDFKLTPSSSSAYANGAAYVYERTANGIWQYKQLLFAADTSESDNYGWNVAIHGNTIAVSATNDDDEDGPRPRQFAGSVYVFERNTTTNTWAQTQKLITMSRNAIDQFGQGLAVHGNTIIVGDHFHYDSVSTTISNRGSVFVFEKNGFGVWVEKQTLSTLPNPANFFGYSVALDSAHIVVGAPTDQWDKNGGNQKPEAGAAYVYAKDTSGTWVLKDKLVAFNRTSGQKVGQDVAIYRDTIVAGAPNSGSGVVYSFWKDTAGSWNNGVRIWSLGLGGTDDFGTSVGIEKELFVAGAPGHSLDTAGLNYRVQAGAAFTFFHCPAKDTALTLMVCKPFTSWSGKYTWSTNGLYWDTIPTVRGCDSIIEVTFAIVNKLVTIDPPNNMLWANQHIATAFQWVDCDSNYMPIPGATSFGFSPPYASHFAVIITFGTCTDTSDCYTYPNIGLAERPLESDFFIYPNPSNGNVFIEARATHLNDVANIQLFSSSGQLLRKFDVQLQNRAEISLEKYPSGVYFLRVQTEQGSEFHKLILK